MLSSPLCPSLRICSKLSA